MGAVYKLEPKIRDFILEQKKTDNRLSCRHLSALVFQKFNLNISKSSVNFIIKQAGLSMPVGRRAKKKRRLREAISRALAITETAEPAAEPQLALEPDYSKAILLRAADYILGGSRAIMEILSEKLGIPQEKAAALTDGLLFNPSAALISYAANLEGAREINQDLLQAISDLCQEVRCAKITLSDNTNLYLDGQMHTIWSTPNIPYDFSTAIKSFQGNAPFILFMAPGYDAPTKEFFDFISGLDAQGKGISKITLFDHKFQELEIVPLKENQKRFFICGLWPWQFSENRKVKFLGEFRPYKFAPAEEDLYIADIDLELRQPALNQSLALKGCALKKSLQDKIRLVILSNYGAEKPAEELANTYLCRWPNLEEGFRDYSRKIELFTYDINSRRFFSLQNLPLEQNLADGLKGVTDYYLKVLDLYVRWHFLPEFPASPCTITRQNGLAKAAFTPPQDPPLLKALEYACRRINECEVYLPSGERLWCNLS